MYISPYVSRVVNKKVRGKVALGKWDLGGAVRDQRVVPGRFERERRPLTEIFWSRRPAARSWARLALRRSRRTFLGGGWWPGGLMFNHWTGLGSSPVRNSSNQSGASANWEWN